MHVNSSYKYYVSQARPCTITGLNWTGMVDFENVDNDKVMLNDR